MVHSQESAETKAKSNFPESRIGFSRQHQLSLTLTKRFTAGTEYYGATTQPRNLIPDEF